MKKQQAVQSFASRVANYEGGKTQARIGDVREIIKLINKFLDGNLYPQIQKVEEEREAKEQVKNA